MKSFQERTLEMIEARVTEHGFDCSRQPDWANCGKVLVHGKGVASAWMEVGYDFQPTTYKFTIKVGERYVPSQEGRSGYFDFYHRDHYDKTRFWEVLERELKKL